MNRTPVSANNIGPTQKPVSSELPRSAQPDLDGRAELNESGNKSDAHLREAYAGANAAQEGAADQFGKAYAGVARGAVAFNAKAFDFARTNTGAAFDYAQELLTVRSPSEFVEFSTKHMRKQLEVASAQGKELFAVANEAAWQIKPEESRTRS